ncbi:MAG: hypothetical protein J6S41_00805, partial [Clostridia bacterium]|nr:hypothetical protein [Clostridia bacterium]
WIPDKYFHEKEIEYNPYGLLSSDRREAMRMMSDIETIAKALPGLDCGSCGAPNCTAFAEDIVKCEAGADECTVFLKRFMKERGIGDEREELLARFDAIVDRKYRVKEDEDHEGQ